MNILLLTGLSRLHSITHHTKLLFLINLINYKYGQSVCIGSEQYYTTIAIIYCQAVLTTVLYLINILTI